MMKSTRQLSKKYAFNIKDTKSNKSMNSGSNFKKVNKGFYDDIEKNDLDIRELKKELKKIKYDSIKECVYSNKIIPDQWKTKIGYQDDIIKILASDANFLSYVGKGGPAASNSNQSDLVETAKNSLMSKTSYSNFPKITNIPKINEISNSLSKGVKEESIENQTIKSTTRFKFGNKKKEYNDREIALILEDFRNAFPIKENKILLNSDKNEKEDEEEKNMYKTFTNSFRKTRSIFSDFNTTAQTPNLFLSSKKKNDRQEAFRQSIYTNLIEPKFRAKSSKFIKKKFTQQKPEEKMTYGPFLNSNSDLFYKKVIINDPIIKKYLESINYFGPYYSYCPPCNNRNLEFYKNLEQNDCINLIKFIKKAKGKINIIDSENDKKNNNNNNKLNDKTVSNFNKTASNFNKPLL